MSVDLPGEGRGVFKITIAKEWEGLELNRAVILSKPKFTGTGWEYSCRFLTPEEEKEYLGTYDIDNEVEIIIE